MRNMDGSFFIYRRNIQSLLAEMFEIKNDLPIASEIFCP